MDTRNISTIKQAVAVKATVFILAAAMLLAAAGCSLPFGLGGGKDTDSKTTPDTGTLADTGSLTIQIGNPLLARTIMPDFPALVSYTIQLSRDGFTPLIYAGETGTTKNLSGIPVGLWLVSVDGLDATSTVVAKGSASATIGTDVSVTVDLGYLAFEGQGTLALDVSWPDLAGVASVDYSKAPLDGSMGTVTQPAITNDAGDDSSLHITETNIDAGSYLVLLKFKNATGTLISSVLEPVHVYGNLTTSSDSTPEISLALSDFNASPPVPASFTVVDSELNYASLSWDASAIYTETNFVIERHVTSNFSDPSPTEIIVAANLSSYNNSGISGDTQWYFRIKSRNAFGDSAWATFATPVVVQNVYTSDYYLYSAADLAAFQAAGYTKVTGHFLINNLNDAANLSPLSRLREVGGNVQIAGSSSLTSLTGLENLDSVGGGISITNNSALLTDCSPLAMTGALAYISIDSNAGLANLDGFSGITSVSGNVSIYNNDALGDISGLSSLAAIGGNLTVTSNDGPAFTSLGGLSSLASVTGALDISNNSTLQSVDLPELAFIGDWFLVYSNTALQSLGDMDKLASIGGAFAIGTHYLSIYNYPNPALQNLDGLGALESIGGNLWIYNCDALTSISGLALLETIGGELRISENDKLDSAELPALADISGVLSYSSNGGSGAGTGALSIPALTHVGDYIYIDGCKMTGITLGANGIPMVLGDTGASKFFQISNNNVGTSIAADGVQSVPAYVDLINNDGCTAISMDSLASVGTYFRFYGHDLCSTVDFSSLVSVGMNIEIGNNTALLSIGMPELLAIPGYFWVYSNTALQSLGDMGKLASIGGAFAIGTHYLSISSSPNPALQNLDGLGALESIGGNLWIYNCDALTSISGLALLETIGGELRIIENNKLDSAELPALADISGFLSYSSNGGSGAGTGALSIPVLTHVGNYIHIDSCKMTGITLGTNGIPLVLGDTGASKFLQISNNNVGTSIAADGVQSVPAYIDLYNNDGCTAISMDSLASIGSSFRFNSHDSCTSVDFSSLQTVGTSVEIGNNTALLSIGMPELLAIPGYFWVYSNTALQSLGDMGKLASIGGAFAIGTNYGSISNSPNPALQNLDGLGALESIGGNLWIYNCDALTSISGLALLETIGGELRIIENNKLASADLVALETIGGLCYYWYNGTTTTGTASVSLPDLVSIVGNVSVYSNRLTSLSTGTATTGEFVIGGHLDISDNVDLASIAIDGVTHITGYCNLYNNPGCSTLSFADLHTIDSYLVIYNMDALVNLGGFTSLGVIGGNLGITDNNTLGSISMGQLVSVGGDLTVRTNNMLTGFGSMPLFTTIDGSLLVGYLIDMWIYDNPLLEDFDGLSALETIGVDLIVAGNHLVTDITLPALESIGRNLAIVDNDGCSAAALAALTTLGGNLEINDMDGWLNLSSLSVPLLSSLGGSLIISNNDDLTNIDNMGGLTLIGGDLTVTNNVDLADLGDTSTRGLWQLESIGGAITITGNGLLEDISALGAVTGGISGGITITDNDDPGFTTLAPLDGISSIGGSIMVNGNAALTTLFGSSAAFTSVGGSITVQNNPALLDLAGIRGASVIAVSAVSISNNANLSDLSGLTGITTVSGQITIDNNDMLTALPLMTGLLQIGNYLTISNNDGAITDMGFENLVNVSSLNVTNNTNTSLSTVIDPWSSGISAIKNISGNAP